MTEDYFTRRLRSAMRDGADIAEDLADDPGVALPPEYVGRMGLALFSARLAVATADSNGYDLPDDEGLGSY